MKSRLSINNLILPLLFVAFMFFSSGVQAQLDFTPRSDKSRVVDPGKGQTFSRAFFTADNFHFVQFGVYPMGANWRDILAPSKIGQVWLIIHYSTQIKGKPEQGAYYIVKPFPSAGLARDYVAKYKKLGIDCWYNPQLHGVPFTIMGITY
ncbi:MAG: hypothetical protein MRZ79_05180 [Bacteroidia bacterium]|nr:hypothetical protein [Bacteroidia bacterium]